MTVLNDKQFKEHLGNNLEGVQAFLVCVLHMPECRKKVEQHIRVELGKDILDSLLAVEAHIEKTEKELEGKKQRLVSEGYSREEAEAIITKQLWWNAMKYFRKDEK